MKKKISCSVSAGWGGDRLLEYEAQETLKGSLKQAKELVQFDLQNTNYPPSCLHPN